MTTSTIIVELTLQRLPPVAVLGVPRHGGGEAVAVAFSQRRKILRNTLGKTVVVGLSRTAFDFKAVGDGVVALVDLDSKVVTGFLLDGLKNCTDVDAIPRFRFKPERDRIVALASGENARRPRASARAGSRRCLPRFSSSTIRSSCVR